MKFMTVAAMLLLVVAGCASDGQTSVVGVSAPNGFQISEVIGGFDGPTQVSAGPGNSIFVAQLNGEENGETGQILLVDDGEVSVVYEGLDKPTGVALLGDQLYVMERNRLSVGSFSSETSSGEPLEVVVDELPTNGRSEGTLTVTPNSTLLYNTSGSIRNGEVVEDSGILWELEPGGEPVEYAKGFKHAYAHFFGPRSGELWVSEIGDGQYDGKSPEDEIVAVKRGDDGGWPRCVGDRLAVAEYGGNESLCADTSASLAVFGPRATPTSLVVAPWDDAVMLVALWNEGRVVALDLEAAEPVVSETFVEGIVHPQHLLVVESAVWIVDIDAGRILSLEPA